MIKTTKTKYYLNLDIKLGVNANYTVIAREYNLNKSDGETKHQVCNMTYHPQFGPLKNPLSPMNMDFAILTLCEPLMFDKGKFFYPCLSLFQCM